MLVPMMRPHDDLPHSHEPLPISKMRGTAVDSRAWRTVTMDQRRCVVSQQETIGGICHGTIIKEFQQGFDKGVRC